MISGLRCWVFGGEFLSFGGREKRFLVGIWISVCPNSTFKSFEGRSTDEVFVTGMSFEWGFSIVKNHGREVIIFPQNFKTHGILL